MEGIAPGALGALTVRIIFPFNNLYFGSVGVGGAALFLLALTGVFAVEVELAVVVVPPLEVLVFDPGSDGTDTKLSKGAESPLSLVL